MVFHQNLKKKKLKSWNIQIKFRKVFFKILVYSIMILKNHLKLSGIKNFIDYKRFHKLLDLVRFWNFL